MSSIRPSRRPVLRLLAQTAVLALCPALAAAQVRVLPADAKAGRLTMGTFPLATLDGKEIRLAAGARIFSTMNTTLTPSMVPENSLVKYRLDAAGNLMTAWILDETEARGVSTGTNVVSGSGAAVGTGN